MNSKEADGNFIQGTTRQSTPGFTCLACTTLYSDLGVCCVSVLGLRVIIMTFGMDELHLGVRG